MSEVPVSQAPVFFRFSCPHCRKVLKVRKQGAGQAGARRPAKGLCPQCKQAVDFPHWPAHVSDSPMARQLLQHLSENDHAAFDDAQSDRLALFLSQGTCGDYRLAARLLAARALSARQWRRALNAADVRESMRHRLQSQIAAGGLPEQAEPVALCAISDAPLSAQAWSVMARLLHFQRHGACPACVNNPTGMACDYLAFDAFLARRQIPQEQAQQEHLLIGHHLGL